MLGAGEMKTNKKRCCPAGLEHPVEETDVNTIALEVDRCCNGDGRGAGGVLRTPQAQGPHVCLLHVHHRKRDADSE